MEIPTNLQEPLQKVGGVVVLGIGLIYAWKTYQAAFNGKVRLWTGLEKFGFLFIPITLFISPLFCLFPSNDKRSLIHTRQQGWVHLFWGPAFFLAALAFITAGMDMMGLPGSEGMNFVLTAGRHDIPRAVTYVPPSASHPYPSYRFPILKKATRTILKALTKRVPTKREDSWNQFEKDGEDVESFSSAGDDKDDYFDKGDQAPRK